MDSIEKILQQIRKNTEEEIKKIKDKTLKKCDEIIKNMKTLEENETKKMEEKLKNKKKELENSLKIELNQFKNSAILCKKEEILKKTINDAFKFFCEENLEEYEDFIKKVLMKNSLKEDEDCEILVGSKDYNFIIKIKELNDKKNIKKATDFAHGFKIVCKKYILNFDIENIFKENILKIKTKAAQALNLEETSF